MTPGPPDRRVVTPVAFAMIGSEMVGCTLLGVGIDYLTGWVPWATVTGTLLGLVAAMMHLARIVTAKKPGGP